MKLFLVLVVLAAGYCYVLLHTSDMVINQTMQLSRTYQNADAFATKVAGTDKY